jgi:hypothetical protein
MRLRVYTWCSSPPFITVATSIPGLNRVMAMKIQPYDVWYDPNEIDDTNHAQVLRACARPNLEITFGKIVLLGDDEQAPVPARNCQLQ